jgi:broad specificity phosphatase PhoE
MNRLHMVALASAGLGLALAVVVFSNRNDATASSSTSPEPKVQPHEAKDVKRDLAHLKVVGDKVRPTLAHRVVAMRVDDAAAIPEGAVKVHLIRHGVGHHNVAQAEWRGAGKPGEPYTLDTDPDFVYRDAELTSKGEQQARALQSRANALSPELMVTSPMRRATQTGLLAFDKHVAAGKLPVVAHEGAHEIGGKHTCDKRLSVTALKARFPAVDYSFVADEEDPLWLDGRTRETHEHLARRAAGLVEFLRQRPEKHVVVAAHSMLLATLLNAVLVVESDDDAAWFGTAEMRTFLLEWRPV